MTQESTTSASIVADGSAAPLGRAALATPGRRGAWAIWFWLLAVGGAVLVWMFQERMYLTTETNTVAIFVLAIAGLWKVRLSPLSPLSRLMILLYFMPFTVCWGHVFDVDFSWWNSDSSRPYIRDPHIMAVLTMTGLIGLVGLLAGLCAAAHRAATRPARAIKPRVVWTLSPWPFAILLALAFFFSYINTPDDTIMSASYTAATGVAGRFNFNAAFMVAYTLLVLLYIDADRETRPMLQRHKRWAILGVCLFILVFFQLLRGDRDSFGLVVALMALYLTGPRPAGAEGRQIQKRRYVLVGGSGAAVLVGFLAISSLRTRVAEHEKMPLGAAIQEGYQESTWGAVLLTNLSLAAQYEQGRMQCEYGQTYVDYLKSLPPGFITNAMGLERPIEPTAGPSFWFMDVSAGGIHIVAVPFKNFYAYGVLAYMILCGAFIGWSEVIGQRSTWLARLWYGSVFVGSAQWFWYGDMTFIREIMAFVAVALLYEVSLRLAGLPAITASQEPAGPPVAGPADTAAAGDASSSMPGSMPPSPQGSL